jgi:hypothetical protein
MSRCQRECRQFESGRPLHMPKEGQSQILFNLPPEIYRTLEPVARTNKVSFDPQCLSAYTQAVELMRMTYPQLCNLPDARVLVKGLVDTPRIAETVQGRMKLLIAAGISARAE